MVQRLPILALLFFQVVGDVALEMTEPSIRYENIGVGDVTLFPHAQQFDLLPIVSEALESQFHVGLTDKLNL